MIRNQKGTGSIQVVIITAILVFVLIPIFLVLLEKIYLKAYINKYEEICSTAIMSCITQIDDENIAVGNIYVNDIDQMSEYVLDTIENNMNDNIEIESFTLLFYNENEYCDKGNTSEYAFFHLEMIIIIKRITYQNEDLFATIHIDLELPKGD